jgi:hypothetical protein
MLEEMIAADEEWKNTTLGQMMIDNFTTGMSGPEASKWQEGVAAQVG